MNGALEIPIITGISKDLLFKAFGKLHIFF
jgi:hypothetical protein